MELHQLRYFCAVASTGSFTRAAESAHVAQPSLSQQIRKLEDELGVKLIDRLGRETRLTTAGKRFLPRAQAILKQVVDAKREVEETCGALKGDVTLGVIPTIAPYFLPSRLARFSVSHTDVRVRVIEEMTPTLIELLHAGSIDLALLALPVGGREFTAHEIGREPLFAVLPEAHPLAPARSVSLADIDCEQFLLLKEGHCFRDTVISACKRARVGCNVVFESGQFATILALVAAGVGVSVVPAMAVQPAAGCRFVRVQDAKAQRRFGLVHLKHHFLSRAQLALLQELRSSNSSKPNQLRSPAWAGFRHF